MNKQFERYLKSVLIALDLLMLNFILIVSQWILARHLKLEYKNSYDLYWILANSGWLMLCFFCRTYDDKKIVNFVAFTKRTLQVYFLWITLILFVLFFFRAVLLSRIFILVTLSGFGAGLLVNRFLHLGISKYFRNKQRVLKKVIIIGFNETAKKLTRYLEREGLQIKIMGYIENDDQVNQLSHYPVLAGINDTLTTAKALQIEEIYSTITPEQNNDIYNILDQAEKECIRFKIVPDLSLFIN
ncbi:MAG: undecaprenyl-phosphate glucose phosphotransferase, partial [Ginsengibacter sp.]